MGCPCAVIAADLTVRRKQSEVRDTESERVRDPNGSLGPWVSHFVSLNRIFFLYKMKTKLKI